MDERKGTKSFFAAANSGYGFYSFYNNIFEDSSITERYIIKGGPGTGKSRFMKEIAFAAREVGFSVESYCCSSDPSSLDGVIVDIPSRGRICVLDGTAPHICEASLPGARDTILNFCEFWDATPLKAQKEKIRALNREKQNAYLSAGDCLSALLRMKKTSRGLILSSMDSEKIRAAAKKFFQGATSDDKYFERMGIASSFGMFGEYTLSTYESAAEDIIALDDTYAPADIFLSSVLSEARERKISSYHSRSWLDPERIDAVYLPSLSLSFVSQSILENRECEKIRRNVNMEKYADKAERARRKSEKKDFRAAEKELLLRAATYMAKMRECHFSLEEIYVRSMDFSKKEAFCASWIEENIRMGL